MSFLNKMAISNAKDAIKKGSPLPIVTLRGPTDRMPKEGDELIGMGYKFHSVRPTLSGVADWYFALPEVAI